MDYTPGFFSFNSPGGRCEECKGEGTITIEMQFMADITLPCESCHGKRYSKNALEVLYRGKNISDVLDMTVNQAIEFFSEEKGSIETKIVSRLKPLHGHIIIIIEHNMDVIKCADYIIDMGPDGGDAGGEVVTCGTPEEVAACDASITGHYALKATFTPHDTATKHQKLLGCL